MFESLPKDVTALPSRVFLVKRDIVGHDGA